MSTESDEEDIFKDHQSFGLNENSKAYRKLLLARKLRLTLKAQNTKIGEFALKLGKSPSEISKWLSGSHNFTLDTLLDIEDELGIILINVDLPYKTVINGSVAFEVAMGKPKFDKGSNFYILITHEISQAAPTRD